MSIDNFVDPQVHTSSTFSEPALLPRFAVRAEEEAVRLLAQSVESASRRRKFSSAVDFHRALRRELANAISQQNFEHVKLLFDYQVFLSDIRGERLGGSRRLPLAAHDQVCGRAV